MAFPTTANRNLRCKWTGIFSAVSLLLVFLFYLTHASLPNRTLDTISWLPTRHPCSIRITKAAIALHVFKSAQSRPLHRTKRCFWLPNARPAHANRPRLRQSPPMASPNHHQRTSLEARREQGGMDNVLRLLPPPFQPLIPLHTFVPPHVLSYHDAFKALTIIGTKTNSIDMDTSVFFIRVNTLSLRFLTLAMSAVYDVSNREWGSDIVGTAMREVLKRQEWRQNGVWVPREW
jgi:hypothetical protein